MSHQIHAKHAFGGGFVSLKVKAKPQQQLSKSRRVLSAKTRWVIALYFCVYVLGDHSLILRKFTQGWRGCKVACEREFVFNPPQQLDFTIPRKNAKFLIELLPLNYSIPRFLDFCLLD